MVVHVDTTVYLTQKNTAYTLAVPKKESMEQKITLYTHDFERKQYGLELVQSFVPDFKFGGGGTLNRIVDVEM